MFTIRTWRFAATVLTLLVVGGLAWAEPPAPSAVEIESRLSAAYEKVRAALVWIEGTDGKDKTFAAGAIVSAGGYVLMPCFSPNYSLSVYSPTGELVPLERLGWSREWNIALARLKGTGPWPHVGLGALDSVRAGQPIATVSYALNERKFATRPLLDFARVELCAPGKWFLIPPDETHWKVGRAAFDLDGRLLGFQSLDLPTRGTVFTHGALVQSLWSELTSGANLDEQRLRKPSGQIQPQQTQEQGGARKAWSPSARQQASNATVQIRSEPGVKGFSGVLISGNGMVATCAHHFYLPGAKVTVSLPDGRDLEGKVLGISFPADIGLVRITEPGPFPYVEPAFSTHLRAGDICYGLGYGPVGAKERQAKLRELTIEDAADGNWSFELPSEGEEWDGGDCGGGVFDSEGRFVAILLPGSVIPHGHKRVEVLAKQWQDLLVPLEVVKGGGPPFQTQEIEAICQRGRALCVEILNGKDCVALGTVGSPDGLIVTKASTLGSKASCRLSDGRVLSATRVKTVREDDIAVLKIETHDLPQIEWSSVSDFSVGTMLALPGPTANLGVVSHAAVSVPPEFGYLWTKFRDKEEGVEVEGFSKLSQGSGLARLPPRPLRTGDIIRRIEGHATRNREELNALFGGRSALPLLAGDGVRIKAERNGKTIEYDAALWPPNWPRMAGQSTRCSGFEQVHNLAVPPTWEHPGGPVLDRNGRAIGIAIAGRQKAWALVLPAARVVATMEGAIQR